MTIFPLLIVMFWIIDVISKMTRESIKCTFQSHFQDFRSLKVSIVTQSTEMCKQYTTRYAENFFAYDSRLFIRVKIVQIMCSSCLIRTYLRLNTIFNTNFSCVSSSTSSVSLPTISRRHSNITESTNSRTVIHVSVASFFLRDHIILRKEVRPDTRDRLSRTYGTNLLMFDAKTLDHIQGRPSDMTSQRNHLNDNFRKVIIVNFFCLTTFRARHGHERSRSSHCTSGSSDWRMNILEGVLVVQSWSITHITSEGAVNNSCAISFRSLSWTQVRLSGRRRNYEIEDREFVVDSDVSLHMVRKYDLH